MSYENHANKSSRDDFYLDPRTHHLSSRQDMRALELDPHHFHKVLPETKHHDKPYFTDGEYYSSSSSSSGGYFEDIIGYNHRYYDYEDGLSFSSSEEELNDIQFSINEDVQFKLESEDNY